MNKHMTRGIAIGLAVMAGAAYSQSNVVIYGVADVGVDYGKVGSWSQSREVSGALAGSRLGFRGTEDLGNGLSAVFRIEMGLNHDTGSLGQGGLAWGREASVGLSSTTWGTLSAGRIPTPYYQLVTSVGAFQAGQSGGLLAISRSTAASNKYLLPLNAAARTDNSLLYTSPTLGGVQVRLHGAVGEGSTSLGRMLGGSVRYTAGPWDVLVAGLQQRGARRDTGDANALTAGGSYDAGVAKVFAGYTREQNDCLTCTGGLARIEGLTTRGAGDFRIWNLGVRVPFGQLTAIAEVLRVQDRSDYAAATGKRDAPWIALGGEYALSKRTRLWGSAGALRNKNGSQYVLSSGPVARPAGIVGSGNPSAKNIGVGITHSF